MSAPLTAVLAEIEAGVRAVPDLAARTGLAPDLVRAVVGRLVRSGRVTGWSPSSECAPTGCRDCASAGCPLTGSPAR